MMQQVDEAHNEGKYLFMWDKTDQIDTFFKYKGFLFDFYFQHMRVENEQCTVDDAIEALRSNFIKAGRQGQHLLINLKDKAPDFINVYTKPEIFATEIAFNRNEWRKEEVHKAVLKQDENYSASADDTSGIYYLRPEHTMQIRTTVTNADAVRDVISKIPNFDQFKCIIIE